ncbi:MAG: mechanosensitive ion channel, partial [Candidatus Latescibacterota bacterium]
ITTIPTYALISNSFKNWRGMEMSGGRRIKRSVNIDINSIRFLTPEMIEKLARIKVLEDYISEKKRELAEYNEKMNIDDTSLVNGRRMTNVGTFRAYLVQYLRHHPKLHQEMTLLVRQLQPTEKGLPIEIYVFSRDQRWVAYEEIQADIFDHIFAALPEFGLRPYQLPTGSDLTGVLKKSEPATD